MNNRLTGPGREVERDGLIAIAMNTRGRNSSAKNNPDNTPFGPCSFRPGDAANGAGEEIVPHVIRQIQEYVAQNFYTTPPFGFRGMQEAANDNGATPVIKLIHEYVGGLSVYENGI